MRSFKDYMDEVAANSVAGGGVATMDVPLFKKRDKRKKEDTDTMYKRSLGLKHIKAMVERRKKNA